MAEVVRVKSLEIDQHVAFTLREWQVERAGWAVFALVLAAAFAGLLGGAGPLAQVDANSTDGALLVQYSRITRLAGLPVFIVKADPALATDGTLTVALSSRLTETMRMERIEPEPEEMTLAGTQQLFKFKVDPSAGEPYAIRFGYRPDKAGLNAGAVEIPGGPSIEVRQFVWP